MNWEFLFKIQKKLVGRGGQMKRVKEGKYGRCIFYTYMNMEHRNLLKLFFRRGMG
jgi:hypothetical protein